MWKQMNTMQQSSYQHFQKLGLRGASSIGRNNGIGVCMRLKSLL